MWTYLKVLVVGLASLGVLLGFLMVLSSRTDAPLDDGLIREGFVAILGGLVILGCLFI